MTATTISREQARQLDRRAVEEYGMSSIVLMENAGRGVADRLCELGVQGLVTICCGSGNNGGDGFVVGRHLDLRGHAVRVLVFCKPDAIDGDAAANYRILLAAGIPVDHLLDPAQFASRLAGSSWIVDALLGTGARGEPRPPLDAAIEAMNASGAPLMAVDLPSGLDCDTGKPASQTVHATHTCTFVAPKPGLLAPASKRFVGRVHVVDIGAPRKLVEQCVSRQ
jgi:NAD(P)H-hydrate epimerase